MPYIAQARRDEIIAGDPPRDAGELNFAITHVVDRYLMRKAGYRYADLNDVLGALEGAKLEVYRRVAAPYEDRKRNETGDVYASAGAIEK